jgi:hypothetical protein
VGKNVTRRVFDPSDPAFERNGHWATSWRVARRGPEG